MAKRKTNKKNDGAQGKSSTAKKNGRKRQPSLKQAFTKQTVEEPKEQSSVSFSTLSEYTNPLGVSNLQSSIWSNPIAWSGELWHLPDWSASNFCRRPLKFWEGQQQVIQSVRDHRLTCVRSGNGVGKTMVAAAISVLFMISHYPCTVVTTGSSWRILEKVLWPQIRELINHSRIALGDEPMKMSWMPSDSADRWVMVAASAKDKNNFAGFHNRFVLVIIEEADGVEQDIFDGAQGIAVGQNDRILAVGNPHTANGPFHQKFKSKEWNSIHLSCFDHPNVRTGKEIYPGMVTRDWVELMAEEVGPFSPAFKSRVKGEFPDEDESQLVPFGWLELAGRREPPDPRGFDLSSTVLSVDVARAQFGDESCFLMRNSQMLRHLEERQGMKTTAITRRVIQLVKRFEAEGMPVRRVVVDDTGVGGGVTDQLQEQMKELRSHGVETLLPFVSAARASDPKLFVNQRSESYWNLRMALDPDMGSEFYIPPRYVDRLLELSNIQFGNDKRGRILILSKDELIKSGQLKRSPNRADALMMSMAKSIVQREKVERRHHSFDTLRLGGR